jgi:transposase
VQKEAAVQRQQASLQAALYKLRWRIDNGFNTLKDFRRIATRYDKLARNYLASAVFGGFNEFPFAKAHPEG